jgi:hypothetical protein
MHCGRCRAYGTHKCHIQSYANQHGHTAPVPQKSFFCDTLLPVVHKVKHRIDALLWLRPPVLLLLLLLLILSRRRCDQHVYHALTLTTIHWDQRRHRYPNDW